ncbi:FAD-dependent monooxygenase [Pelagibacteraceae bacterium]|nr:FAD-dependent monooxygenase [Pelagibacteraceae bacterium]
MKEIQSNLNIVGGGLIGASLAYSLSKLGNNIVVLEQKSQFDHKKILDKRTTAISEGTKKFLEEINIWKEIKYYAEPIKKIQIIDRNQSNKIYFDNQRRNSNLGYIVKNEFILDALYKKLQKQRNVKIFNNVYIKDIFYEGNRIITKQNNFTVNTNLLLASDGKNSLIRKIFKTPIYSKDYKKKAIVINFYHSKSHQNTAYEFFFKNGPLAILPMQKNKNSFQSSIVWTNTNEFINSLISLGDNKIKSILNEKVKGSIGEIKKIISKQTFPLSAHLNSKFFENRIIYIGDSAHSFHPIAGQGWNLGMQDVESLYNLVKKYNSLGIELGDEIFCKEFQKNNFFKAYRLYQITDKVDSVFKLDNTILNHARFSAINLIEKSKKLKNKISDFAMGVN